jgi:hypothetical protein
MRIACFITKATNTRSEYVILTAFPRRWWLHRRAPMLRYTYTACLVLFRVFEDGRIIPQRRRQMLLSASFLVSVQCHCRSMSKERVVFAVVVTVAVLSTCSIFSASYSSQQVVGGRCFFRRYRSGCCKWSALAASLVQWPRGDLIMPVKTLVLCAPILLDDTVTPCVRFCFGGVPTCPRFDTGLFFLWNLPLTHMCWLPETRHLHEVFVIHIFWNVTSLYMNSFLSRSFCGVFLVLMDKLYVAVRYRSTYWGSKN